MGVQVSSLIVECCSYCELIVLVGDIYHVSKESAHI
jgi:hypothetical protein